MQGRALRVAVPVAWDREEPIEIPNPANDGAPLSVRRRKAPRRRTRLPRVLREPLIHFLVVGCVIFAVSHVIEARSNRYAIELGPDRLQRLAITYAQQYGEPPTPAAMQALTDSYVREEVLRREGAALGLDKDDEIVRRRIAQKFEFLLQDRIAPRDPTEAELRQWFDGHRADYVQPPRRTFDHVYFAIDRRGEEAARRLADQALARLQSGGAPPQADQFPGPSVIRLLSQADTERLFGGQGFAQTVFRVPVNLWQGPFRSSFGWHVVKVTEAEPARARDFAEARDEVLTDWKRADRQARNDKAFAEIRAQYHVTGPGGAQ